MKVLVIGFVCCLFVGGQDRAAGVYEMTGEREAASELSLKANGTFEFAFVYGAADYWAKGAWKRDGNVIVLQSDGKAGAAFRLKESGPGDERGLKVWVKGTNGRGVENIDVAVRTGSGGMEGRTTDEGLAYFADAADPINVTLQVRVFGVEFGPVVVPKGSRELSFEINGKAITEMRFEAERLVERNGRLELRKFDPAKAIIFKKR